MFSKIIFSIPCLLAISLSALTQTTIIVVRTSELICIGTDSKQVNNSNNGKSVISSVCKIHKLNDVFVTAAGSYVERFYSDAGEICKSNLSLENIINSFVKVECIKRKILMDSIRKVDKIFYANNFKFFRHTDITFCAYENNIPKVYSLQFFITSKPDQPAVIRDSIKAYINTPQKHVNNIVLMGHKDYINKIAFQSATWDNKKSLNDNVESLIQIECDKDSDYVGRPVNILAIIPTGHIWLKNPTRCAF